MANLAEGAGRFIRREFREHPLSTLAGGALIAAGISVVTYEIEEHYHNIKDGAHVLRERAQRRIGSFVHDFVSHSGVDSRLTESSPDISELPEPGQEPRDV